MRRGFTLAEILITLTMIGVVAALSIPSLVGNIQDSQFRSAWKKVFADISQVHSQIMMDNGGTFAGAATGHYSLRDLFKNKMNYTIICTDTSCAATSLKKLDGSTDGYSFNNNLVLSNGIIIYARLDSPNCTQNIYLNAGNKECGWLLVDVNGKSNPNQWGKDIYGIWVLSDRILPWGANPGGWGSVDKNESTCATSGYGCGAKYLYN